MQKRASTSVPIHDLIAERWSPRVFDSRSVESEKLASLFEAARWAPSCFNEQPWVYLAATREDAEGFEKLASCLMDGNAWAREAPVLILSVAQTKFARNGKDNRHAQHDVGLATQNLGLQAEALGLVLHQMAGFDAAKASEVLGIPDDCEPMAMIALGYPGDASGLDDEFVARESAPRERKPLGSVVFGAGWEQEFGPVS